MYVNSATYNASGIVPQPVADASGHAGGVTGVSSVAAVTNYSALPLVRPAGGASKAGASAVVDLSATGRQAGAAAAAVGSVQAEYNALASAEAAQKQVLAKVADIRAAVRQAATTEDRGTRELLQKQVSASLAQIEATAGEVQAQSGSGAQGSQAAARQEAIVNSIDRQKMVAQAAVYLVTSESGSRTVRVSTTDAAGRELARANTSLGDIGMHLRSLGGEVYFVPDVFQDSGVQESLSQTLRSPEGSQALIESGVSGRITINGRPYNPAGLSGLSPMQVASLAGVASESGNLQEAMQDVSQGKDVSQVASERRKEEATSDTSTPSDTPDESGAPEGSETFDASEFSESQAAANADEVGGSAASASAGNAAQSGGAGLAELARMLQPDSGYSLSDNPQQALALAERVYNGVSAQSAGLGERLEAYRQAASDQIGRMLSERFGGLEEIADSNAAERTVREVAGQLARGGGLPALAAGGVRNAYQLLADQPV